MTAPPTPARPEYQRPVISASRLVSIGGEKGAPGCERKLAGQYLFGMKQASSDALEFGSALHSDAEEWQATGVVPNPEGDVARVLSSGIHLIKACGELQVEYEHRGTFPDGSPYVAFLDGGTDDGGQTYTVVVQDLKTTSNPKYALVASHEPAEAYALRKHVQAMMYAWVLLCDVHWYAPRLPHGHIGPQQWRVWDPEERRARHARLRWLYFLTRGVARAWEVTDHVSRADAQAYYTATIAPLVAKINALHEWHFAHPGATLDEIDRNLKSCDGRGKWCGVYEHNACSFEKLGTPALDLVQLKVRKMTSPQERLAALRNRNTASPAPAAAAPSPVETQPTPKVDAPTVAESAPASVSAPQTPANSEPAITPAAVQAAHDAGNDMSAELSRGQKAAATRAANKAAAQAALAGAPAAAVAINPPECAEALAKLTAATVPAADPVSAACAPVYDPNAIRRAGGLDVTELCDLLIAHGYAVTLTRGARR